MLVCVVCDGGRVGCVYGYKVYLCECVCVGVCVKTGPSGVISLQRTGKVD